MTEADAVRQNTLASLHGKRCSHIRFGGSAGTAFHLSLGKNVRINPPEPKSPLLRRLATKESPEERYFRPEFGLMIWSSWRLSAAEGYVTSSQVATPKELEGLRKLEGLTVERIAVKSRFHDLEISFSTGLTLDIFCDREPAKPSDAAKGNNWAIFEPENFIVGA